MKRVVIVFVFVIAVLTTYGQEPKKVEKKSIDPPKKETVKSVPKSSQKQAQIRKTQVKKTQIQNKKKKQVVRKAKAIRRKGNG